MDPDIEQSTHELLLRLAGRLPDQLLWRFRDWLGEGAMGTLARTLPRSLLKHRIDLDQTEYRLLVAGLIPHGADWHQVSSTLGVDDVTENRYTFTSSAPEWVNSVDSVSVLIHATLRGRPDVAWPDRTLVFQWHRGDQPEPDRAFAGAIQIGNCRLQH